jgi:hypothetical protein
MDLEKLLKNSEIKGWIKKIAIGVIGFIVIREIIAFMFFDSIFKQISRGIYDQELSMKEFQQRANDHIKEVEAGMNMVMNNVDEGRKNMQKNMASFDKNFAESSGKALKQLQMNDQFNHDETAKQMIEDYKNDDSIKSLDKSMERNQLIQEKRRLSDFMIKIKPYIECEKKLYGSSSFDPAHPYDYKAFPFGLPEQCKKG